MRISAGKVRVSGSKFRETFMAHRKAGGSTQLGRDSISKRLGVKIFGDQKVKTGQIIIRQRGSKYHPGKNVKQGEDDTLFALADGFVKFSTKKVRAFTGKLVQRRYVSVADKIVPKKIVKAKTVAKVKTVKAK